MFQLCERDLFCKSKMRRMKKIVEYSGQEYLHEGYNEKAVN